MSIFSFKITRKLPEKARVNSYLFTAMGSVDQLRPQRYYNLQDTRNRHFDSDNPQLLTCSFHGAYNGDIYPLSFIKYFSNTKNDYINLTKDDPNFNNLLKIITKILDAEVVLTKDQDEGYEFISYYQPE